MPSASCLGYINNGNVRFSLSRTSRAAPSHLILLPPLMNAVAPPPSRPVQLQPNQQLVPSWEFTRRKRWADLLMTELSEAVVLVLSPRRKVLFCNPAVHEILGWQDEDLIDRDFKNLVNGLSSTRPIIVLQFICGYARHSQRQTQFLRDIFSLYRAS
jgi:PAS domain-containing protein